MSNAEVEKEIIEALEASSEPRNRNVLFEECPSALSADHVSRALNALKKRGIVQPFGSGNWGLTGDYEENMAAPAAIATEAQARKQLKIATLQKLSMIVHDEIRDVLLEVMADVERTAA